MSRKPKQRPIPPPQTSLFPFLPTVVQHPRLGLWIALSYGLLMLFIGLKYHVVGDYGIETDFFWSYVPEARNALKGTIVIQDFHGPVYPMLLALIGLVTGDFFHGGVVLATASAAITLYFAFALLRRFLRADQALFGTLLIAVNTTFVQYTYSAGTDMVFNAFVTSSAFLLFSREYSERRTLIASGLLAGMAYLVRYNGVFVVAAVPVLFLLVNPYRQSRREQLLSSGVFLGAFFLAIAPWGIYCLIEKGSFFYNKNYLNIAYEMFGKGKMGWDQYWSVESQRFSSLAQVVFSDFGLFVRTVFGNVFDHGAGDLGKLLGWHTGVFVLAGIVLLFREKPTMMLTGFLLYSLMFFCVLLLVFYGERFSMFLLVPYAGLALRSLSWPRLTEFRFWNAIHIGGIAAVILVAWTLVESYNFNKQNIDSGPKEILDIAEWFQRNDQEKRKDAVVIARKPHVAYYLNMQMGGFPYVNTYEELMTEAKKVNARYLYFSVMEAGMRPQFQYLLDPLRAPRELRPMVYTVSPPAVLYKIEWLPNER